MGTLLAEQIGGKTRQTKNLPPRFHGMIDWGLIAEKTGISEVVLRRHVASGVDCLINHVLPHQPMAAMRFVHELPQYMMECQALAHAIKGYKSEIERLAQGGSHD